MPVDSDVDLKEINDGKILAVISYLWILCFVSLLLKKDNKFAYFHAKQGLVIFLFGVLNAILAMILPIMSWVIVFPLSIVLLIFTLFGIIEALMGKYARIPVVSNIAEKINI